MKKNIQLALLLTSLLWGTKLFAQQISLHTGRLNPLNTQLAPVNVFPVNSFDDTWMIRTPGNSAYQNVKISSGVLNPGGGTYPGSDNTVRWLAPSVNSVGEHLDNQAIGDYYYRMQFTLDECTYAGCKNSDNPPVIVFNHIGGDNYVDQITINTTNHAVNFPYNPFVNNFNIQLSPTELQIGLNEIVVRVHNLHNWTGLEINGYLELNSMPDFKLLDKNGVESSVFCLMDDIFLDPGIVRTNAYNIKVKQGTQVLATGVNSGDMGPYNISNLLRNVSPILVPGTVYTIESNFRTECGWFQKFNTFEYTCCEENNNAAFSVMLDPSGMLTTSPLTYGQHVWEIFSTPSANTGPYTPIQTIEGNHIELQGVPGKCYHVKHTVNSECGSFCDAQTVCVATCEMDECILPQPTAWYSATTGQITWLPVAGAQKYIVVVTTNDPACCNVNNGGAASVIASTSQSYDVYNATSFPVTPPNPPFPQLITCYSYRVYAICPDGTPSPSSQVFCFGNGDVGREGSNNSEVGIDEMNLLSDLKLLPNPANGNVYLKYEHQSAIVVDVIFENAIGMTVKGLSDIELSPGNSQSIDISDLPAGIYFIHVKSNKNEMIQKLVIE